jgi:hypothetical protein
LREDGVLGGLAGGVRKVREQQASAASITFFIDFIFLSLKQNDEK